MGGWVITGLVRLRTVVLVWVVGAMGTVDTRVGKV